jgi:hypothetical protein
MATKSKKTTGKVSKRTARQPEPEETQDEPAATGSGIERVFKKVVTDKQVQPNWRAFSEYVSEHGGPTIKPEHVGVVLTGYKYFQKSDSAVSAREESAAARESAKAEREAAREARSKERAEKAAEREERKAAREKAATAKKTATKKTAAAASKPASSKKTASKTAGKKKGSKAKAAF